MSNNTLKEQAAKIKKDLFDQGSLDRTFRAVERNFGEDPKFHEIMVNMFFNNSAQYVAEAEQTLKKQPIDFAQLENRMVKLWKANNNTGAKKVKELCVMAMEFCRERDTVGCQSAFQELKIEHTTLHDKLRTYFELVERANADDGASSSGASSSR